MANIQDKVKLIDKHLLRVQQLMKPLQDKLEPLQQLEKELKVELLTIVDENTDKPTYTTRDNPTDYVWTQGDPNGGHNE